MRRASVFRGPETFFLMFGGIWLLVGVPFFVIGAYLAIQTVVLERRLEREGRVVSGVVLKKFTRTHKGSRSYWVRYRFTPPGGQEVEAGAEVERGAWERLAEQEPISVRCAASDSRLHRVEGEKVERVLPLVFSGVGALFGAVGGVIFGKGVRRFRRRRRLEREGIVAEGTVTQVVETHFSINRVRQWKIHYTYSDYRGQSHGGDSGLIPPEEASAWQVGDKGTVRFDPARTEESIWVGKDQSEGAGLMHQK